MKAAKSCQYRFQPQHKDWLECTCHTHSQTHSRDEAFEQWLAKFLVRDQVEDSLERIDVGSRSNAIVGDLLNCSRLLLCGLLDSVRHVGCDRRESALLEQWRKMFGWRARIECFHVIANYEVTGALASGHTFLGHIPHLAAGWTGASFTALQASLRAFSSLPSQPHAELSAGHQQ